MDAASFIRAWNYAAYGPNATQLGFFLANVEGYDDLQGDNPKAKELSGLTARGRPHHQDHADQAVLAAAPRPQLHPTRARPMAQACLDDIKACNEQPIGNGPYEFAEKWQHNESITLRKYADYTDEANAGLADEITFKVYADLKTAYRDFQAGSLDIVTPDPSQTPQARTRLPRPDPRGRQRLVRLHGLPASTSRTSRTSASARPCRWRSTARRSSTVSWTGASPRHST